MGLLRDVFNGETALDYPRWWRRAVTEIGRAHV